MKILLCVKRIDILQLCQYRNATNILGLVNQLCQEKLPIEYADVKVVPSHDVQGPEVTAISISSQSQAADLRAWLCNQLQQKLDCKPSQVKMIHVSSTKELARTVVGGTMYENSVIQIDEFQGCETYVGVVFLGMDNNYSQLLEMCSRAQYKLILVISRDNSLLHEIKSAQTEITVLDIEDVQVLKTDPGSPEDQFLPADSVYYDNPSDEIGIAQAEGVDRSGSETVATAFNEHCGNQVGEIQDQTAIEMRELSKKKFASGTLSSEDLTLQSRSHEGEGVML